MNYEQLNTRYALWLADCLTEYNHKCGESRSHFEAPDCDDYDPCDVVEFSDTGDAYPHSYGGTGHVAKCVTPWIDSPHFCQ